MVKKEELKSLIGYLEQIKICIDQNRFSDSKYLVDSLQENIGNYIHENNKKVDFDNATITMTLEQFNFLQDQMKTVDKYYEVTEQIRKLDNIIKRLNFNHLAKTYITNKLSELKQL